MYPIDFNEPLSKVVHLAIKPSSWRPKWPKLKVTYRDESAKNQFTNYKIYVERHTKATPASKPNRLSKLIKSITKARTKRTLGLESLIPARRIAFNENIVYQECHIANIHSSSAIHIGHINSRLRLRSAVEDVINQIDYV